MSGVLAGRRVLIVEDQYLIACEMQAMIASLGGDPCPPAAGRIQAMALIETEPLDLAILDVDLDGHQAYSIAEELKRRDVRFLFATGYGREAIDPAYRDVILVEKPVSLAALSSAVARLLNPLPA